MRMKFKITSEVVPTVRKNFSRKYRRSSLLCPSCRNTSNQKEDTQVHLIFECPAFEDLRKDKNMENDQHLTDFFKAVVAYRIEHDEL